MPNLHTEALLVNAKRFYVSSLFIEMESLNLKKHADVQSYDDSSKRR